MLLKYSIRLFVIQTKGLVHQFFLLYPAVLIYFCASSATLHMETGSLSAIDCTVYSGYTIAMVWANTRCH
jgi:hypothetical protein